MFLDVLRHHGLSEHDLQEELREAMRVLTAAKKRNVDVHIKGSAEPCRDVVLFALVHFKGTSAEALDLESALAGKLMDRPTWRPEVLSVEFNAVNQDVIDHF